MYATSWCDLDLTFDLAYLMLFYLSYFIIQMNIKMGEVLKLYNF